MGTIRDKMTADLDLRGFASTTKKECLQRAQNFVAYYERPPTELGEQEIREFLLYLVNDRQVGVATQHMYIAAIKFLYATTLDRPEVVAKITPAVGVGSVASRGDGPGATAWRDRSRAASMFGSADGTGAAARFNNPSSVAVDSASNVTSPTRATTPSARSRPPGS